MLTFSDGPVGTVRRKENGTWAVYQVDLMALELLLRRARKWSVR